MTSKIIQNRKKLYTELVKSQAVQKVISRDKKDVGVVTGIGPDYFGPAGRSSRLWVLWPDGNKNMCTVQGMEMIGNVYHIR